MDTNSESTLLSVDYRAPTIGDDLSNNTLVRSESNEPFRSEKPVSNISITQLLDVAVTGLKPSEARFQKIKSGSCQVITISDSDDSDGILRFNEVHSNDEPIPLELELSLLDYEPEDSRSPKSFSTSSTQTISVVSDLSASDSGFSPSQTSGNVGPNNNFSRMSQMLTNFDDPSLSLEEKVESEAEIKVQPRLKLSPESNATKGDYGFSCTQLPDVAVTGLKPSEARFQKIKSGSCQVITISDSDDSDGILRFNEVHSNDEPVPLELELSQTSGNVGPNNNFSRMSQMLTNFDDPSLSLEEKVESEAEIKVQPRLKLSPESNATEGDYGFSCTPSSTKRSPNDHQNSSPNNVMKIDILALNCNSSDNSNSIKDCTIDDYSISGKLIPSESPHKSEQKPKDLSSKTLLEISNILKDCNDNILDPDFDQEILSLEPVDIQENDEVALVKTDLSNSQLDLKKHLKENFSPDTYSDPSSLQSCLASKSPGGSSLTFPLDLTDRSCLSIQKNNCCSSCSLLKDENSPHFVLSTDFGKRVTGNKICKHIPQALIVEDCRDKTTQKMYRSVNEQSSRVGNRCRNSTDKMTSSFGEAAVTMNVTQQHFARNDWEKKRKGCLDNTSKGSSLRSLGKQMFEKKPLMIISVNTDDVNRKRIVTLGKQLGKGENSLVTLKNKQDVKSPSNDDYQLSTAGNQSKKMQIKTTPEFDKTHKKLPLNEKGLKDFKDMPKDSNMIIGKMPTAVPLIAQGRVTEGKTSIKKVATKSESVPQRNPVTPVGVKKRKKAKKPSAKKLANALPSMSKKVGFSSQAPIGSVNADNALTGFKSTTGSAESSSGNIPRVGSNTSSSPCDQISKRKFVKAKRGLHKQKEQATSIDESEVNDRVQWVCRRWNVETLSNQDINLTTSAYIRSQLPTREAACFQGCLEGQKDYTLAIVAPNRKRRLHHDDYNIADDNASKKRRLSKEVQLIPVNTNIKDLTTDRELFGNKILEMLAESRTVSLVALDRQRNQELNWFNEHYHRLKHQLQEKQFQQWQYYNNYHCYNQQGMLSQLQYDHKYQRQQSEMTMCSQYNDLKNKFREKAKELHTLYKTSVEKLKSDLSTDVSDSGYLTIALRSGPTRRSSYKTTYRNVCLTPQVALAMTREDEIYDSFYSHKLE